jgi:small subunit ribosomal protein S17
MSRNIGLSVSAPKSECTDSHCPFHGNLPVRGKLFEGTVVSAKARKMVVVQRETPKYLDKFKRYARSKSTIHAFAPSCLAIQEGAKVVAAECRPLSKSVSFVVVEIKS